MQKFNEWIKIRETKDVDIAKMLPGAVAKLGGNPGSAQTVTQLAQQNNIDVDKASTLALAAKNTKKLMKKK